jgi:ectoine hydroxylase-related dioxygenase (phytanoyl-CoA dioxygenase family)
MKATPPRQVLTAAHVDAFERDGFVVLDNVFSAEQVGAMIAAIDEGGRVDRNTVDLKDREGFTTKLSIWHELGDDIWSTASTWPAIVNAVRILVAEDVGFFHGKVMLKEPRTGGAWEWHQDYGYWYDQGFLFPRMISAFVALDRCDVENGCLEVLRGSHRLGRLNHGSIATEGAHRQTGAELERVRASEAYFERVPCVLQPGSVLFFHCNLLHASGQNTSDRPRRSFIVGYNALGNPQLTEKKTTSYEPCPICPDDAFERFVKKASLSSPAGVRGTAAEHGR